MLIVYGLLSDDRLRQSRMGYAGEARIFFYLSIKVYQCNGFILYSLSLIKRRK